MARLLTLRRNLARLLTRDEVDDNFVNVASDFSGDVDPATLAGAYVAPYMRWADTGTGWLKRRNAANNAWMVEQRLLRRTVQPFSADELPSADDGPIYVNGQGMAEFDAAAGKYRVVSPVPVGGVAWWPLRSSIPAGQIPADGQTISRATFPDIAAMVTAGTVPVVSEADWQAAPLKRGCYTLGDGATTIRVPDYNGMSPGAVAAVTLRGDGARSAGTAGAIQPDQLGPMSYQVSDFSQASNVLLDGTGKAVLTSGMLPTATMRTVTQSSLGLMWITNTGDETRMTNVSGVWTIQAFGAVTNPGAVDAAQLASNYAALNAAFQSLQGKVFGYEQGLIDVWGTRALGVTYTNSTGRPIVVYIQGLATAANAYIFGMLNEALATISNTPFNGGNIGLSYVVPPGATYRAGSSYMNVVTWREYR